MSFYARTRGGAPEQLLKDHLQNVAGLAEGFAREARPAPSILCRPSEAEA